MASHKLECGQEVVMSNMQNSHFEIQSVSVVGMIEQPANLVRAVFERNMYRGTISKRYILRSIPIFDS